MRQAGSMHMRLLGLDLARFLAIAGMIIAHTVPEAAQGPVISFLVNGNASTLFAVASGFSVVLASARYLTIGAARQARVSLLLRGTCLIILGVLLGTLPQQAVIVLVYLGLALCLATIFITAPSWVLTTVAAFLAVLIPPLNFATRIGLGTLSEGYSLSFPDFADPLRALRAAALTGTYPALTWLVYVLIGMLIARVILAANTDAAGRRSTVGLLALGGTGIAVIASTLSSVASALSPGTQWAEPASGAPAPASWWSLLLDVPHSGTLLDVARGGGIAATTISLCLMLCWAAPRAATILRPAIAAGAAPLSSYVLHILTLAAVAALARSESSVQWWQLGWGAAVLNIGLVLTLGAALAITHRRGPFEALLSRIADRMPRERDSAAVPQ